VTGLDNIRLFAKRPPWFSEKVRPMLNVGGLVRYPRGAGGIILCNLKFVEPDDAPENPEKKRAILAGVLRNLKAPFAGGRTIIAGANLAYEPMDLSKQANQYRTDRGWFGDRTKTFAELPGGRQTLAGVPFVIHDFPTSPVPTVVMLGGPGVPGNLPEMVRGIPVNRKADALFFLQAARIDRRRDDREVREHKTFELAHYVVTYADGQTATVPIRSEIDVDDYRQKAPTPLPGAQVGWTRRYPDGDLYAVAYVQQWTNPRPLVEVKSVDLVGGDGERRGVPALIAVTVASARGGDQ
jgi:beta-galactosidase